MLYTFNSLCSLLELIAQYQQLTMTADSQSQSNYGRLPLTLHTLSLQLFQH